MPCIYSEVILNWLPEEQIPWALGHLQTGASKAGRTLADIDIACLVRVCVADEVSTARQWLRCELTGYAIVEAYRRSLQQIGFRAEAGAIDAKWRVGDRLGAMAEVSDQMTDRLAVFGTAAQCQARLGQFAEAGITLPIVFPFSPHTEYQASIHSTLAELRPVR